jgi:bacterioferritin
MPPVPRFASPSFAGDWSGYTGVLLQHSIDERNHGHVQDERSNAMKGNDKLLSVLNQLLANELTAINQYMVQSEMCENWGYVKLRVHIRKQAMDEMHHAEWLTERILYLEDTPTVSKLNPIKVGKTVAEIISNDNGDEVAAVRSYNEAITLARSIDDEGTAGLLSKILAMEEGHVSWAESQQSQVEQMGLENYLANQTASAS